MPRHAVRAGGHGHSSGIRLGDNAVILHKTLYGLKTAYPAELRVVPDALASRAVHPLDAEPCLLVQRCVALGEPVALPIAMTYPGGVVVAGPTLLGGNAHRTLDGKGWKGAWVHAWCALENLKDPVEQSVTLVLTPRREETQQLSASALYGDNELEVVVLYEDMVIERFIPDARGNHDREGHTYRAAQLADEAVTRWSRVVREIELLRSVGVLADVYFEDVRAAEMKCVLPPPEDGGGTRLMTFRSRKRTRAGTSGC